MADQDRFEARLAGALGRYADEAPERQGLVALAESITARPQRPGILVRLAAGLQPSQRGLGVVRPSIRLAWLLLIAALLALIVGQALVGALQRNDELSIVPTEATEGPSSAPPALWVAYTIDDLALETHDIWITDPDGQTRSLTGTPDDGIWRMCPQFSPSGRYLARVETKRKGSTAAPTQDWVLVVSAFDAGSGSRRDVWRWPIRSGFPDCGAWSADGATYAYPSPRGSLMLLDVATGRNTDVGAPVGAALTWSPDGGELASLDSDGVHIRSLDTGADRLLLGRGDYDFSWVFGLSWSPDGTMLAASGVRYNSTADDSGVLPQDDSEFIIVVSPQGAVIDEVMIGRHGMSGPNVGGETLTMGPAWSPDSRSIAYGTSMMPSGAFRYSGEVRTHSLAGGREGVIDPGDSLEGPGLAWIDNEWLLIVGRDSIQLHAPSRSADRVVLAESLPGAHQELWRGVSLTVSSAWTLRR